MSKPTPTPAKTEDGTMDTSKSVSKEHGEERLPDVKTTTFKTTDRSEPEGTAEVSAGVEQDQLGMIDMSHHSYLNASSVDSCYVLYPCVCVRTC